MVSPGCRWPRPQPQLFVVTPTFSGTVLTSEGMKGRIAITGSPEGAMLERIVEILLEQGFTEGQIAAETEGIAERHRVKEHMMNMLNDLGQKKPNQRSSRMGHSSDAVEHDPVNASGPEEDGTAQAPRPVD